MADAELQHAQPDEPIAKGLPQQEEHWRAPAAVADTPLTRARKQKLDEFYTQLTDIEYELKSYRSHFEGKVVYCNCDDPTISNFYRYFNLNFDLLGLKQIIATCYRNQNYNIFSQGTAEHGIGITRSNTDGIDSLRAFPLEGDGDFRSSECIELLKQADVVVTNPPFSLFREYVAQLIKHEKSFLIIGNINAITYKEIFPLIKDNRLWIGSTPMNKEMLFDIPDYYADEFRTTGKEGSRYRIIDGVVKARLASATWFTNLEYDRRYEDLVLWKKYLPDEYPKYDNYDAIEVSKTAEIPGDYAGEMGVPITFLDKHNPEQFQIVDMDMPLMLAKTGKVSRFRLNGKELYARIVIRNRRL